MNPIDQMRADWDKRAAEDAYYYVAFAEHGQGRDQFLATGANEVHAFESQLVRLTGDPQSWRALEVGCGPGRLMLPMSRHFGEIHGVDISPEMIRMAEEVLAPVAHAHAQVTPDSTLRMFPDEHFDFVYSHLVFQHIPSREVVLHYMREIHRVLKPSGISCYQMQGAPPPASVLKSEPTTWTGCSFTWEEVKAFAAANGVQLVGVQGIGTQYMVVTARKTIVATGIGGTVHDGVTVQAVTPASGAGDSVPNAGRGAAVSLWVNGFPDDCGLQDLAVEVSGRAGIPIYLGPKMGESGYQINVLLPEGLRAGAAEVRTTLRGAALETRSIGIIEAKLEPAIIRVMDGLDVGRAKVRSGTAKVIVEGIANPGAARFQLDGKEIPSGEFVATDRVASQYQFSLNLPGPPSAGQHTLTVLTEGASPASYTFEVEPKTRNAPR